MIDMSIPSDSAVVFSRSYCSSIRIGYWHDTVVCPSVGDEVYCG